jgi:hypothetical protein
VVFSRAHGSEESCPVCGWIDDLFQLTHPEFILGANSGLSLREAQVAAMLVWPVSAMAAGSFIRDNSWRPLQAGESPRNGTSSLASPVCYLNLPDAEEFEPYWLESPESHS